MRRKEKKNKKVEDRMREEGRRKGRRRNKLVTEFTGKEGVALKVCILEILKKTRKLFCVSKGPVGVAHILSCAYGIGWSYTNS